jgi:hypothetical protein
LGEEGMEVIRARFYFYLTTFYNNFYLASLPFAPPSLLSLGEEGNGSYNGSFLLLPNNLLK